ncbi:MAG TPA: hypothetical protein VLL75_12615 [Vicinamibacteria bacterium]|nr:hypothetical protein [Vicinamibacteria bacterium]
MARGALRTPAPPAGLGHLGVQLAARMGYETVAIARVVLTTGS